MFLNSITEALGLEVSIMKVTQTAAASPEVLAESARLGELLSRLRVARRIQQSDAAVRAGLSRNTAYRLERGDPGVAFGQLLRYLNAIAPGLSLRDLLTESDPALKSQALREQTQRVRSLSDKERKELDF
jgi:transcriptional regulator with XRE-family HTH domain